MHTLHRTLSLIAAFVFLVAAGSPALADESPPEHNPSDIHSPDLAPPADLEGVESDFQAQIIGGTNADSSRGMAAVLLNGGFRCSGSIVHNRWVLTAKHCLYRAGQRVPDSQLSVRVKSLRWNSGGGVVNVIDSKVRTNHDIAMLKLSRSANAEPVRLPTAHSPLYATTYMFGWGNTCTGSGCGASSVLKRATQSVISNSSVDTQGGQGILTTRLNGSACRGDSGGPLFKLVDGKRYQVGVMSGVSASAPCTGSAWFASVPVSRTWIQNVIRNH